jgi:hypothetical protein
LGLLFKARRRIDEARCLTYLVVMITISEPPIPRRSAERKLGTYRGELEVPDSFFDPPPDEELEAFEGEGAIEMPHCDSPRPGTQDHALVPLRATLAARSRPWPWVPDILLRRIPG